MVLWADGPLWVSNNAMAIVTREEDARFLFYVLACTPPYSVVTGSAQPQITRRDLAPYLVTWPPRSARRAIGSLLASLDDKIELNQRMNETLEAIARAIFRDWFVDFGPTRAKMAGAAPYLAADLWELFPTRLDEEGKPERWRSSTIGAEVAVVGGSTPSTKENRFWDGSLAWATPRDLSRLEAPVLLGTERKITEAGLAQISSGLLPSGTVLLSSRAPIGYLAIAETPCAVNQGFIAMKCEGQVSNLYAWLWADQSMDLILQHANGSTFQEISKRNFRPLPLIVPEAPLLTAFDELVRPIFNRIISNQKESQTLAQTRDLLLPKLMSGEIRLKEAERILEDAA